MARVLLSKTHHLLLLSAQESSSQPLQRLRSVPCDGGYLPETNTPTPARAAPRSSSSFAVHRNRALGRYRPTQQL